MGVSLGGVGVPTQKGACAVSRRAIAIELTPTEKAELERRVRARTASQQAALRARIVLLAAERRQSQAIAAELDIARGTVRQWRNRFAEKRIEGVEDKPHCPPPRRYGPPIQAMIVVLACQSPESLGWAGQTHWSNRDLAAYIREHSELDLGTPSKSTVGKILQAHDIRLERL